MDENEQDPDIDAPSTFGLQTPHIIDEDLFQVPVCYLLLILGRSELI